jgi:hypothetical protein
MQVQPGHKKGQDKPGLVLLMISRILLTLRFFISEDYYSVKYVY